MPTVGGGSQLAALKLLVPAVVLILGLILFFALGLDKYASFEALAGNRRWLIEAVTDHAVLSALIFFLFYATMIAFSIPGGAVMSVAGGFLFGQWFGLIYNVSAATLGATILFLAAKLAVVDVLRDRAGPWLKRMEDGFRENAFSYLLALRLVPAFPFWAVNLAAVAYLGVQTLSAICLHCGLCPHSRFGLLILRRAAWRTTLDIRFGHVLWNNSRRFRVFNIWCRYCGGTANSWTQAGGDRDLIRTSLQWLTGLVPVSGYLGRGW